MDYDERKKQREDLLKHVVEILQPPNPVIEDQMELIVAVLMILLGHPMGKSRCMLYLIPELTTEIEGKLLDKICVVLNKTYSMKGEEATLHDDTALELIRDYLLEHDEFIFYKNEKRILRKPVPNVRR